MLPVPIIVPIDDTSGTRLEGQPRAPSPRRPWAALAGTLALAAGLGGLWVGQADRTPIREEVDTKIAASREQMLDMVRPAAPIPDDLEEKIARYIADYGRHFGPTFEFHGAILVARDGKVHYAKGFGMADPDRKVADTPSTRFRIGMLTEQFTAAAILQLRDAGMLQLDDP